MDTWQNISMYPYFSIKCITYSWFNLFYTLYNVNKCVGHAKNEIVAHPQVGKNKIKPWIQPLHQAHPFKSEQPLKWLYLGVSII